MSVSEWSGRPDERERLPRISPSAATIPPEMWDPDPPKGAITCSQCESWWTAPNAAHCSGCCRTFASVALFDMHRSAEGPRGTCLDPASVVGAVGERRMFFRAGMWRGPEMTDEVKARFRR